MKSLRRANRKDSTEETRDRSISPSNRTLPHPKRLELPHLGWSNDKKQEFDQAVTPPGTPIATRSKITLLPARPMDERSYAADEPESPTGAGRKASVFGNVRDRFAENKAQRRREGLKKMIRVVPNVGPTEAERRASIGRSDFEDYEEKKRSSALSRLSDYGWV